MSTTFIRTFTSSEDADVEVGFRKSKGYSIIRIEPTDRIQLDHDKPPSTIWDSGDDINWILVIATKDHVVTG